MDIYLLVFASLVAFFFLGKFAWKTRGRARIIEIGEGKNRTITAKTKNFSIVIDVATETMKITAFKSLAVAGAPPGFAQTGEATTSMYGYIRSKEETDTRLVFDHKTDTQSSTYIIGNVIGTLTQTTHTSTPAGFQTFKTGRASFVLCAQNGALDTASVPYFSFEGASDDMNDLNAIFKELRQEFAEPQIKAHRAKVAAQRKIDEPS